MHATADCTARGGSAAAGNSSAAVAITEVQTAASDTGMLAAIDAACAAASDYVVADAGAARPRPGAYAGVRITPDIDISNRRPRR